MGCDGRGGFLVVSDSEGLILCRCRVDGAAFQGRILTPRLQGIRQPPLTDCLCQLGAGGGEGGMGPSLWGWGMGDGRWGGGWRRVCTCV